MFKSKYLKSLAASVVLASALFVGSNVEAEKNFTDLNSDPSHAQAVQVLNRINAFDYKEGTKLNGSAPITRAEVAKILNTLFGGAIPAERKYSNNLKDVNSKTKFYEDIVWAYEVKIFDGDNKGNFNPSQTLTRAQMTKILVNAFGLNQGGSSNFKDVNKNHWAYPYISTMATAGFAQGYGNGKFGPEDTVTLNQFATFTYRIIDKVMQSIQSLSVEEEVLLLVNVERSKEGLPPLEMDWNLSSVAKYKSQDMYENNYFDHTSPTYGSPFDMMENFGISYRSAGENIAMGSTTAAQVVNLWMNSPGHRANIMNPNYTHMGIGYVDSYWTQMFIEK